VRTESRRAAALAGLVLLQSLCAAFFVGDVLGDLGWPPRLSGLGPHLVFEAAVSAALIVGVAFGARETRRVLERQARVENALAAASGAFAALLEAHFDRWGLTPAERDVALLSLKGLGIAEIAALRGAAQGTVRSQCARVYAKAGVTGRAQLASLFLDELMAGPLGAPAPAGDGAAPH
jgi:DNA-binding CsgD family transcriptional regulator